MTINPISDYPSYLSLKYGDQDSPPIESLFPAIKITENSEITYKTNPTSILDKIIDECVQDSFHVTAKRDLLKSLQSLEEPLRTKTIDCLSCCTHSEMSLRQKLEVYHVVHNHIKQTSTEKVRIIASILLYVRIPEYDLVNSLFELKDRNLKALLSISTILSCAFTEKDSHVTKSNILFQCLEFKVWNKHDDISKYKSILELLETDEDRFTVLNVLLSCPIDHIEFTYQASKNVFFEALTGNNKTSFFKILLDKNPEVQSSAIEWLNETYRKDDNIETLLAAFFLNDQNKTYALLEFLRENALLQNFSKSNSSIINILSNQDFDQNALRFIPPSLAQKEPLGQLSTLKLLRLIPYDQQQEYVKTVVSIAHLVKNEKFFSFIIKKLSSFNYTERSAIASNILSLLKENFIAPSNLESCIEALRKTSRDLSLATTEEILAFFRAAGSSMNLDCRMYFPLFLSYCQNDHEHPNKEYISTIYNLISETLSHRNNDKSKIFIVWHSSWVFFSSDMLHKIFVISPLSKEEKLAILEHPCPFQATIKALPTLKEEIHSYFITTTGKLSEGYRNQLFALLRSNSDYFSLF